MVSDIHAIKLKYCDENIKTKNKNIPPQIKAMDEEGVIIEDLSDKQWFCPECSRNNDKNVKICKCGYTKEY